MDLSLKGLEARLTNPASLALDQDEPSPEGFRPAALIVPLVPREDGLHLIFNKRAANLDNHPGQVSFPGGRRDPEDPDLLTTAKRELHEELSIAPDQHSPLCRLKSRCVISYYYVTPFVSLIDPAATIVPDPGEVAYAFEVPLAYLAQPGTEVRVEREMFGELRTFYAWKHSGETIWGATGRIIADFLLKLGASHLEP